MSQSLSLSAFWVLGLRVYATTAWLEGASLKRTNPPVFSIILGEAHFKIRHAPYGRAIKAQARCLR